MFLGKCDFPNLIFGKAYFEEWLGEKPPYLVYRWNLSISDISDCWLLNCFWWFFDVWIKFFTLQKRETSRFAGKAWNPWWFAEFLRERNAERLQDKEVAEKSIEEKFNDFTTVLPWCLGWARAANRKPNPVDGQSPTNPVERVNIPWISHELINMCWKTISTPWN